MKAVECDVAIVGAGAAGCMAAIGARREGARVAVIEKAIVSRSGSAGGGEKDIACHLNEGEAWDTDQAARDWYTSGETGNYPFIEPDVADINVRRIREVVRLLEEYGLEYRKEESGRYFRSRAIGTPGNYLLWFKNGHEFKKKLDRQLRLSGARVLENVCVASLLAVKEAEVDKVTGVLGFSVKTGETYLIASKSIVLATGEAIRLYSNNQSMNAWSTWHSPYNNGTAQALAFEAGAEITGLEFTRTTIHPYGLGATGSAVFFGLGGYLLNSRGERYMKAFGDAAERSPRDALVFATQREIEEGRGPCFVDLRHLSAGEIETVIELQTKEFPGYSYYYAQTGIDLKRDLLPVEVGSLFAAGGILIGSDCGTRVPGLYAAGDCTHFRAGLPVALTTGLEAGEQAARFALGAGSQTNAQAAHKSASERADAILAPLRNVGGTSPDVFIRKLNSVMDRYAAWHRTEASLSTALEEIRALESSSSSLYARNLHELMRAHEALHLLVVAKLLAFGALRRKETRGWHRRDDFPNEDNSLKGHIIMTRGPDNGSSSKPAQVVTSSFRKI